MKPNKFGIISLLILFVSVYQNQIVKCQANGDDHDDTNALSAAAASSSSSSSSPSSIEKTSNNGRQERCEEIRVPMCKQMEYNMTQMPNQFNHETQQEAAMEAHQFWPLVEINCAKELRFFLCSMYTPICVHAYARPIRACRSVCVRARLGCEKYMKKFGFEWPEHMNCDLFPENNNIHSSSSSSSSSFSTSSGEVCMDPNDAESQRQSKQLTLNHQLINDNSNKQTNEQQQQVLKFRQEKILLSKNFIQQQQNVEKEETNEFIVTNNCPPSTSSSSSSSSSSSTQQQANTNCLFRSIYFSASFERKFSYYFVLVLAIACFTSCLFTLFAFVLDSCSTQKRTTSFIVYYPQRPIVYLCACYLFISLGYLLGYATSENRMSAACEATHGCIVKQNNYNDNQDENEYSLFLSNKNASNLCTLQFILVYYFGMASSIWWCILALAWYLSVGKKWSNASMQTYSLYFNMLAWMIPFFKTLFILALQLVDADSLVGLCYVGNVSTKHLRTFVLVPQAFYFLVGLAFLLAGFGALQSDRAAERDQKTRRQSSCKHVPMDKWSMRAGIYSILYTIPLTCVWSCQFYEFYYREEWQQNAALRQSTMKANSKSSQANNESIGNSANEPDFFIFMLKYFMSLIAGILSSIWICAQKSVRRCSSSLSTQSINNSGRDKRSKMIERSSAMCATSVSPHLLSISVQNEHGRRAEEDANEEKSHCPFVYALFQHKHDTKNINEQRSDLIYLPGNDDLESNPHFNFYSTTNNKTKPTNPIRPLKPNQYMLQPNSNLLTSNTNMNSNNTLSTQCSKSSSQLSSQHVHAQQQHYAINNLMSQHDAHHYLYSDYTSIPFSNQMQNVHLYNK